MRCFGTTEKETWIFARMKTTPLVVFFLLGLSSVFTDAMREYHYVKKLKTWHEARGYCREKFNDLVTIRNKDDNDRLLSVTEGLGNFAWIGLYDDMIVWRWTLGNTYYNKNTNFSNWAPNEPDNKFSKQMCTAMNANRSWTDENCHSKFPTVCFYKVSAEGPPQHILVKTKMTMGHAKRLCRANYTDLVRVRNMSENNLIPELTEKTWIGLFRWSWAKWSDHQPRRFANWMKGQPDNSGTAMESCAVVNTTTGKWLDVACTKKHYFICYKIPVWHKKTFKLKFQSESNLNDPAVQQQVLEQLHAKLQKHGLPDSQLRWIQTDGQIFHKELKRKKVEEKGLCG